MPRASSFAVHPFRRGADQRRVCLACGKGADSDEHFTVKCSTINTDVFNHARGSYDVALMGRNIIASTRRAIAQEPDLASERITSWDISLACERVFKERQLPAEWWTAYGNMVVAPIITYLRVAIKGGATAGPDALQVPPSSVHLAEAEEARMMRAATPPADVAVYSDAESCGNEDKEHSLAPCEEDEPSASPFQKRSMPLPGGAKRLKTGDDASSVAPSIVTPGAADLTGRPPTTTQPQDSSAAHVPLLQYITADIMSRLDAAGLAAVVNGGVELQRIAADRERVANENAVAQQKIAADRERVAKETAIKQTQADTERMRVESGVCMKEAMANLERARADRLRAELELAKEKKKPAPVVPKARAVSLRNLVCIKLLPLETARAFIQSTPFEKVPLDWNPVVRNVSRSARLPSESLAAALTRDVVFHTAAPLAEVAATVAAALPSAGSPTPDVEPAVALPMTQPSAPQSDVSVPCASDGPVEPAAAVRATIQSDSIHIRNINNLLCPKAAECFGAPPRRSAPPPTRADGPQLLSTVLRLGLPPGAKSPPEWSEEYYLIQLSAALRPHVAPIQTSRGKVYAPKDHAVVRDFEAEWRKNVWPTKRGIQPAWIRKE